VKGLIIRDVDSRQPLSIISTHFHRFPSFIAIAFGLGMPFSESTSASFICESKFKFLGVYSDDEGPHLLVHVHSLLLGW
jgi:hypothetical protein